MTAYPHAEAAGVRKAPRHEIAAGGSAAEVVVHVAAEDVRWTARHPTHQRRRRDTDDSPERLWTTATYFAVCLDGVRVLSLRSATVLKQPANAVASSQFTIHCLTLTMLSNLGFPKSHFDHVQEKKRCARSLGKQK
jgi:hypothetical protein